MISVKLLNHGIEYVCILECVCVCVASVYECTEGSGWEPGGLAAVSSLVLGNSPPPAEIQTLRETVLEGSLLRSLIPHPLFTEHLLGRHQALCSGYRLSCAKVLCSGLLLWWTSQGVRCKQIHRAQAGEKFPAGHRPCRMRTSVAKTGLLWEGLRLHSLEKALLSNDFR